MAHAILHLCAQLGKILIISLWRKQGVITEATRAPRIFQDAPLHAPIKMREHLARFSQHHQAANPRRPHLLPTHLADHPFVAFHVVPYPMIPVGNFSQIRPVMTAN